MKKRTSLIAAVGLALASAVSAPAIAQAAATGTVAVGSTTARQVSEVSAEVVAAGAFARPELYGGVFYETVWGGSSGPASELCESGTTAGVHNWSSPCLNNEDAVHNNTSYYARVHYGLNGYGAYACMNPNSQWLYLSTSSYDFSYPGEGYQPYGANWGRYQLIYDNAASEALDNSCS
jgi:hypothetical protein